MNNKYNLNCIQRELDFGNNINSLPNKSLNNNLNKFNLNQNFIPPFNNYMINYSQTPQNGIKSFSFVNNNFHNPYIPINNNIVPLEYKSNNLSSKNINSNNTKINSTNNNNCNNNLISDVKFIIKEEQPLDFKINLEKIITGKDKRTTIMLRNIPNKYTLMNLVDEINNVFLGKIDYINLPIDYEVFYFLFIKNFFREN